MLVTSIFSFSHNVFKSLLFQGCEKLRLFGKELKLIGFCIPMCRHHTIRYTAVKFELLEFNPLPDDKILDQTKLKAFADDKLNVTKMIISVFDRIKNILGKAISPFPTMFLKGFFPRRLKRCHCVGMG